MYDRMSALPGGRRMFSWMLGRRVPYAGSIRPQILEVEAGRARVRMPDRRAIRNHLGSVHASALGNLGELAANLAISASQPDEGRWIVERMAIEYLHKARGPIVAQGRAPTIDWTIEGEVLGEFELADEQGRTVARGQVGWKVGPRPAKRAAVAA
ncbi:hotdog fold domain-containing protein [Nannocystaceae bacterium ST9]